MPGPEGAFQAWRRRLVLEPFPWPMRWPGDRIVFPRAASTSGPGKLEHLGPERRASCVHPLTDLHMRLLVACAPRAPTRRGAGNPSVAEIARPAIEIGTSPLWKAPPAPLRHPIGAGTMSAPSNKSEDHGLIRGVPAGATLSSSRFQARPPIAHAFLAASISTGTDHAQPQTTGPDSIQRFPSVLLDAPIVCDRHVI